MPAAKKTTPGWSVRYFLQASTIAWIAASELSFREKKTLCASMACLVVEEWTAHPAITSRIVSVFTGRITPFSVMMPAISSAGVTSKAGL